MTWYALVALKCFRKDLKISPEIFNRMEQSYHIQTKYSQRIITNIRWHSYEKWMLKYLAWKSFRGLKNRNFSIFANNCAAGFIYQDAGLEYLTPTIGLFFHAPCYLELLKEFHLVNSPVEFIATSKYPSANRSRQTHRNYYPIGLIDGRIEIHFLHYHSVDEARNKWERRLARINYSNLLFLFSARDLASHDLVNEFINLPFRNKLCLSATSFGNTANLIFFKQFQKSGEMPGADVARISVLRKIRFASLLNNLKDK